MKDHARDTQPIDCGSALRELWDFLDGEMTPERIEAMRRHVERCSRCFPHYDFEKAFLDALSTTRPDCRAPESLRCKLEAALKEAGFGGRCPR